MVPKLKTIDASLGQSERHLGENRTLKRAPSAGAAPSGHLIFCLRNYCFCFANFAQAI
jgi:hypothetical protein